MAYEGEVLQGGAQGAATGGAASGGNPYVAAAGGLIGMATGYVMAQRQEEERLKAEVKNSNNNQYENLYGVYFKQPRKRDRVGERRDPAAGAIAGGIQGLEQGGKFAQMVASYNDKEERRKIEKAQFGNPYDDPYPGQPQPTGQDPYYRGHPSYNPDAGKPMYAMA